MVHHRCGPLVRTLVVGDRFEWIAGISAAIAAGAQILGGVAAPQIRRLFKRRTSALATIALASAITLILMGLIEHFWVVIGLTVCWGLLFAATTPIRQTYLNGLIPSHQRATILSFDSMMTSGGGVWAQPVLGKSADVVGLRDLVRHQRWHRAAGAAVHRVVAARERARRPSREPTCRRSRPRGP